MVVNRSAQASPPPKAAADSPAGADLGCPPGGRPALHRRRPYDLLFRNRHQNQQEYRLPQPSSTHESWLYYASALGTVRTHFEIAGTSHEHVIRLLCHDSYRRINCRTLSKRRP